MDLGSISSVVTVVIAYILIFLQLSRYESRHWLRSALSVVLKTFHRQCWSGLHDEQHDIDAEISSQAEKIVEDRRVEVAAFFAWVHIFSGAVAGFELLARTVFMQQLPTDQVTFEAMRLPQALVLLMFSVTVAFKRYMLHKRMLPLLHWFGMLVLCWAVSPLGTIDGKSLVIVAPQLILRSIPLGGLYLDFPTLCASNLLLACCTVAGYATTSNPADGVDLSAIASSQGLVFAWKAVCFFFGCMALKLTARRQVEAQLGKCHSSAVMNLLGMMCEVVVDLDSHMLLKTHSCKLAGVLMHTSGRSLQGVCLTDFMVEGEDQKRFWDSIRTNSAADNGKPAPGLFTTHFRDSLGSHVKLAVFHVPYRSISGSLNHLIGLREESDLQDSRFIERRVHSTGTLDIADALDERAESSASQLAMPGSQADVATQLRSAEGEEIHRTRDGLMPWPISSSVHGSAWGSHGSAASGSSDHSSRSLSSDLDHINHSSLPNSESGEKLLAEVRVEEHLPITLFTRRMRDTFSLQGDAPCFDDLLVGRSGRKFVVWLQSNANLIVEGRTPARIMDFGNLVLAPFGAREDDGGHEYHVTVSFPAPSSEAEAGGYRVGIKLHEVADGHAAASKRGTHAKREARSVSPVVPRQSFSTLRL